jgi:hypothetical protein
LVITGVVGGQQRNGQGAFGDINTQDVHGQPLSAMVRGSFSQLCCSGLTLDVRPVCFEH